MSNKKKARIAGFLYLGLVLTGIFSLMYIPSKFFVTGDSTATFNNIASAQLLFRYGIVASVVSYIFFLFLPLALYKLLSPVDANYAKLMVILALISIPISFINLQNMISILSLLNNASYQHLFTATAMEAQTELLITQFKNTNLIVSIFWGLWLFPFGYLVYKSGFLPKILGVCLMMGCVGYLLNFFANILIPDYSKMGLSFYIRLPATLGEIGTCLWLLIKGAKQQKLDIFLDVK
jgi:Domain of unknown function (DUF4386)